MYMEQRNMDFRTFWTFHEIEKKLTCKVTFLVVENDYYFNYLSITFQLPSNDVIYLII